MRSPVEGRKALLPPIANAIFQACLQADGTLEALLSSTEWLSDLLDVLCGTNKVRREPDDGVREALAEAVLMLVSLCMSSVAVAWQAVTCSWHCTADLHQLLQAD